MQSRLCSVLLLASNDHGHLQLQSLLSHRAAHLGPYVRPQTFKYQQISSWICNMNLAWKLCIVAWCKDVPWYERNIEDFEKPVMNWDRKKIIRISSICLHIMYKLYWLWKFGRCSSNSRQAKPILILKNNCTSNSRLWSFYIDKEILGNAKRQRKY